jgi:hypothetical protein
MNATASINSPRLEFKANLAESARDIATHGADAGYPYITYTSHTVVIFDAYANEIWAMAVEEAEQQGLKNVAEMIAGFGRADMLGDWDQFKNLMVWYACETVAREMEGDDLDRRSRRAPQALRAPRSDPVQAAPDPRRQAHRAHLDAARGVQDHARDTRPQALIRQGRKA